MKIKCRKIKKKKRFIMKCKEMRKKKKFAMKYKMSLKCFKELKNENDERKRIKI